MFPFRDREMAVNPIHLRRIKRIRRTRGKSMMVVVPSSFLRYQGVRVEKVQGSVKLGALLILQTSMYISAPV